MSAAVLYKNSSNKFAINWTQQQVSEKEKVLLELIQFIKLPGIELPVANKSLTSIVINYFVKANCSVTNKRTDGKNVRRRFVFLQITKYTLWFKKR